MPGQAEKLRQLDDQIAPLQKHLSTATPQLAAAQEQWEQGLRLADLRRLPKNVTDILLVEPAKRIDKQKDELASYYRTIAPGLQNERERLAALQKERKAIQDTVPTTLISISGSPRRCACCRAATG